MPKNKACDLITDQEMTFARLVLSGTMTDRDAAQAAGLNPDTAAYTKAKPLDPRQHHRPDKEEPLCPAPLSQENGHTVTPIPPERPKKVEFYRILQKPAGDEATEEIGGHPNPSLEIASIGRLASHLEPATGD